MASKDLEKRGGGVAAYTSEHMPALSAEEVRAEAKGEEPPEPVIAMPAIAAPAKTTVTSQGKVTVAEYWTGEFVTDEAAAVRAAVDAGRLDLLCYNEKAAKAMIRAGIRNIPGYRVFQELKV